MLFVGDGYLYMSLCDAALCQLECVYGSGMALDGVVVVDDQV